MFGIVYGSDSDNKIMNRFVDEYELWCNEGKNPDIASIDLDFALDLQKKRLDEKGVKIQTAFTDKETVKDETPVNACTAYDMGECKSNIATKTYEVTEKYFKDGKKKKKIKDRFFFYTMITRLENQNSEVACSCPNCGAVSSVRELYYGRFVSEGYKLLLCKNLFACEQVNEKGACSVPSRRNCRRCGIYGMGGCKGRNF